MGLLSAIFSREAFGVTEIVIVEKMRQDGILPLGWALQPLKTYLNWKKTGLMY